MKFYDKRQEGLTACDILKMHKDEMKHDPQHLTTKFLQEQLGIECEPPKPKRKPTDAELLEQHKKFMERVKKYGATSDVDDEYWDQRKKKSKKSKVKRKVKKCRCKK